jgi:hypothetical protein
VVAEGLARSKAGIERVIHIDSSQHMLDLAKVRVLLYADHLGWPSILDWCVAPCFITPCTNQCVLHCTC